MWPGMHAAIVDIRHAQLVRPLGMQLLSASPIAGRAHLMLAALPLWNKTVVRGCTSAACCTVSAYQGVRGAAHLTPAAIPMQSKDLDFFIISEPAWLDGKYSSLAKQVQRPCAALVFTDQMWIT
jgi:Protein of unknown function (DUF2488)